MYGPPILWRGDTRDLGPSMVVVCISVSLSLFLSLLYLQGRMWDAGPGARWVVVDNARETPTVRDVGFPLEEGHVSGTPG